jgi:hypothetical protein
VKGLVVYEKDKHWCAVKGLVAYEKERSTGVL